MVLAFVVLWMMLRVLAVVAVVTMFFVVVNEEKACYTRNTPDVVIL